MKRTLRGASLGDAFAAALVVLLGLSFGLSGCTPYAAKAQNELVAGDLDNAATDVQKALTAEPHNQQLKTLAAQVYTRRGFMSYQHGDLFAAQADFYRALQAVPAYPPACRYLGQADYAQGKYVDAIRWGNMAAGAFGEDTPDYVVKARQALAASAADVTTAATPKSPPPAETFKTAADGYNK